MTFSNITFLQHRGGSAGVTNILAEMQSGPVRGARLLGRTGNGRTESLRDIANRPSRMFVNWGCSDIQRRLPAASHILNRPQWVLPQSNKYQFFAWGERRGEVGTYLPPFTNDYDTAIDWQREGHTVVARATLTGHSGQGITIHNPNSLLPPAPLYTRYMKKKHEFRVHFFSGQIVDVQRKAVLRSTPAADIDYQIRTHGSGFVYIREGFDVPPVVNRAAQAYLNATPLDFGALDIIYNERNEMAYILEVNTAPGVSGTTARNYANAFTQYAVSHQ